MMMEDVNIVFYSQVLLCMFCFLGIDNLKVFISGVTEDYVDRKKFLN